MANVKLKGKEVHTSGELPKVGSKAPDFSLVDADLADRSLKDFAGKKKVLSIVPSLDTSVCSTMAKKFNEEIQNYPKAVVLLISADLPFAQKRFCGAENATHITPLSMMRNKKFAEDYGILLQDGPLAGICSRAVVVLDEKDQVIYTQLVPEITQEPDYEKALSHVR